MRFENFMAGVTKIDGLKMSLKKLDIGNWEIKKEKAKIILNKYNIYEIKLKGL